MCPLRGCPAMFTLLLLLCSGAAAAGSLRAYPLAGRCGGKDCSPSASLSVHHTTSPTLPAAPEWAAPNHRSDNAGSALPSGINEPASGVASDASHRQTPSTSYVFSAHHPSDKLETHFSRQGAEELRANPVTDEATSMSSIYSQKNKHERPLLKDVLVNKLYAGVTLNGRPWPERQGHRTTPKQKKETPAHLSSIYNRKSTQPTNWQSGAILHRSWKHYSSPASKAEVAPMVKGQAFTLTSVSDDVASRGHNATPKEEHADGELARKSGIAPQSANAPSVSPVKSYRSRAEGHLSREYRPSRTPDTRRRLDHGITAAAKMEDISIDSATLPSTTANDPDMGVIRTPDPDLLEQEEEIEEAIARDATLIIVFSCLAVASLAMWRIVRCIGMHKLKKHENRLAADKASSV